MFQGATNYAESVDNVMLLIIGISAFLLIGITAAMIYFVFRYSRKRNPKATQIHGNIALEVVWIVIPTIIVMIMFWYGYKGYKDLRAEQDYAMQVDVWAYMWGWDFEYPNGKKTDTLYIPLSSITRLEMESRDVNHSLYIPAFRLKEDVIGGRKHYLMLSPKKTGVYDIACAEYCGLNHAYMYTKLYVMEDDEFEAWYNSDEETGDSKNSDTTSVNDEALAQNKADDADEAEVETPQKSIEEIEAEYNSKVTKSPDFQLLGAKGCIACHSTDGSRKIGPSFTELADGVVSIKDNGSTKNIEVTREYLKTSIMQPDEQISEGYQKYMMPSSEGMVNDDELERIIDLLMPVAK
jgi:cytochrome c oxidase subunit 2